MSGEPGQPESDEIIFFNLIKIMAVQNNLIHVGRRLYNVFLAIMKVWNDKMIV